MKKIGTPLIFIVVSFAFFLAIILTYASLWGENNNADAAIKRFFEDIQAQNYFSTENNSQIIENLEVFDTGGNYAENCFLLELALLEKYNLINVSEYQVTIDKNSFWVPLIREPDIKVDITLRKKENGILHSITNNSDNSEPIKNLFTVTRNDGRWKISSINLKGSPLIGHFKRLKTGLAVDRFVTRVNTKITVQPIEIETKNLSTIEKRKLSYIFQKINQEIKQSTTQRPGTLKH